MEQSRLESFIEACVNTGIGFIISYFAWPPIAYLAGIEFHQGQQLLVTVCFTVLGVSRQYAIRRWFNTYRLRFVAWLVRLIIRMKGKKAEV